MHKFTKRKNCYDGFGWGGGNWFIRIEVIFQKASWDKSTESFCINILAVVFEVGGGGGGNKV